MLWGGVGSGGSGTMWQGLVGFVWGSFGDTEVSAVKRSGRVYMLKLCSYRFVYIYIYTLCEGAVNSFKIAIRKGL